MRKIRLLAILMVILFGTYSNTFATTSYHAYSGGVSQGTVRYVSQKRDTASSNGWGAYVGYASGECGYASQSMAFSYVGKDVSPEYLCRGEYAEGKWNTNYGIQYNVSGISVVSGSGNQSGNTAYNRVNSMLNNHISDNGSGKYSPVVIHYHNSSNQHSIIIIGKNSDGSYQTLDPAIGLQTVRLTISTSGAIGGSVTYGSVGCSLDAVQQFYNPNGKPTDTTKPTISNVKFTNITKDGYTVTCNVSDNVGVTRVRFPTWVIDQTDPKWVDGTISGNTATYQVKVSDFGNRRNAFYATHIYAYDAAGNEAGYGTDDSVVYIDGTSPYITNVRITNVDDTGYTVNCNIWDNHKVSKVLFVTWTPDKDGFDDKKEETVTSGLTLKDNVASVSFRVNTKDHNNETGRYATHIYAYDGCENSFDRLTNAAVGGDYYKPGKVISWKGKQYELYNTTFWNWTTAKSYCDSIGGYLVCINSKEEQQVVDELLKSGTREGYWIGNTDQYVEGDWTWVTAETVDFTNWQSGQPNDQDDKEDYGMLRRSSGQWNAAPEDVRDSDGNGVYGFICERGAIGGTNHYSITDTGANLRMVFNNIDTLTIKSTGFYFGSNQASMGRYEIPISSKNNNIDLFVNDYVGSLRSDTTYYYQFYYMDNSGEEVKGTLKSFTTEKALSNNSLTLTKANASIQYHGNKYYRFDGLTKHWEEAKRACESMGGHLLTITSADEQSAITQLVKDGGIYAYWAGGTDRSEEGNWKWITGENWNYQNWNPSQPDDGENIEDYLMVYREHEGKWNDSKEYYDSIDSGGKGFICEVEGEGGNENTDNPIEMTYNGHKYELYDFNSGWVLAKEFCESKGGHLVTISSSAENTAVLNLAKKGSKGFYAIGAESVGSKGTWRWITGETFSYSNWDPQSTEGNTEGEPYGFLISIENPPNKQSGEWIDGPDTYTVSGFYHYSNGGFICEYEGLAHTHQLTATAAKAATCTAAGNSAYWTCSGCGKYFSDAEGTKEITENSWVIKAKGHTLTKTEAKAATETQAGNSAYWNCSTCKKYFSDAEGKTEIAENSWVIPVLNHTHKLTAHPAKEATCTVNGNTAYWVCDKGDNPCHKYFSDAAGTKEISENSWIIPAGHSLTLHPEKAATCTTSGNTAYWSCDRCGKYFSDETGKTQITENSWIIPAAHNLTAHTEVKATCTEAGTSAYWSCDKCGKYFSDAQGKTEISANSWNIDALGHDWSEWKETKAATETAEGEKTRTCSRCKITETQPIPVIGHKHQMSHVKGKAASCSEEGIREYWICNQGDHPCGLYFADVDGNTSISQDEITINKLPHEFSLTTAKAATCTAAGNNAYYTCDNCGKFFSFEDGTQEIQKNSWVIDALGHAWGEWKETKAATETEEGKNTRICSRCGDSETSTIPKLSHVHELTAHPAKAATTTSEGNSAYWSCDGCGKYFSDAEGKTEINENSWITPKLEPKPDNGGNNGGNNGGSSGGNNTKNNTGNNVKNSNTNPTVKDPQPMKVKVVKKKTVKFSKVKKKKQVVSPITVNSAQGTVTYKITGGNKKSKKALKVNSKTGKITVKKKTKKGTYKVKVKVTASGNENYNAGSKTVTVKIIVK